VQFLHQCLFSPPKITLLKAIENNQLATWPLTAEAVKKYLPDKSPATDKGSMKRQRQGIRSKKTQRRQQLAAHLETIETIRDFHPPPPRRMKKTINYSPMWVGVKKTEPFT
jgi:hypothetical protein